uniref:Small integral membrane protein 12 n=1 Tax=Romanomermis culicivorax TaxID=13658 RepID=A0A915J121_ROMCU
MLPAFWIALRTYVPYITFPFAMAAGYVGYVAERRFRKERDSKLTYLHKSVRDQREERISDQYEETRQVDTLGSLKDRKFVPRSSLDVNPVGKDNPYI